MDGEYDKNSVVCNVIKRIDDVWRKEQLRQVSKADIYSE